jgi:hypothetical protein
VDVVVPTYKITQVVAQELAKTAQFDTSGRKARSILGVEQADVKRLEVCSGLLLTFSQMAELFRAFERTLKNFLSNRTPQFTRLGDQGSHARAPLANVCSIQRLKQPRLVCASRVGLPCGTLL